MSIKFWTGRPGAVGNTVANTPSGNVSATTVAAAIIELDAEKQPLDADLTALAAADGCGQAMMIYMHEQFEGM